MSKPLRLKESKERKQHLSTSGGELVSYHPRARKNNTGFLGYYEFALFLDHIDTPNFTAQILPWHLRAPKYEAK